MKKYSCILLILFGAFFASNLYAQDSINDCSKCNIEKYQQWDFVDKDLAALKLLRNEIFARHNYTFKDAKLQKHFEAFEWYEPTSNPDNKVELNTIEKHNVELIKTLEYRLQYVAAIQKLKNTLNAKEDVQSTFWRHYSPGFLYRISDSFD